MPANTDSNTPPAAPAATRPPPQVIRVPPPRGWSAPVWIALIVALSLAAVAVTMLALLPYPRGIRISALFLLGAVFIPIWELRKHKLRHRRAAELFARTRGWNRDAAVVAVCAVWTSASTLPEPTVLRNQLDRFSPAPGGSARVVCLGPVEVPEVGEMRFEPFIITATELLWRRLLVIPFALALLAGWWLQRTGGIPGLRFELSSFMYVIALGIGALVTWVWKSGVRPTYVRMAPGIVQVMQYRIGRRKPTIRSYPMEAGTLVVLSAWPKGLLVTLLRGKQKDTLPISQMRRRNEVMERLWRALLSTAPIPKLSDEELIE